MSDNDNHYDFRDQEPLWVRYAEWISDKHDKFYEVRIDLADTGQYAITNRWGARPDTGRGQIKVSLANTLDYSTQAALEKFHAKLAKGYHEVERPLAASGQVEQDWND